MLLEERPTSTVRHGSESRVIDEHERIVDVLVVHAEQPASATRLERKEMDGIAVLSELTELLYGRLRLEQASVTELCRIQIGRAVAQSVAPSCNYIVGIAVRQHDRIFLAALNGIEAQRTRALCSQQRRNTRQCKHRTCGLQNSAAAEPLRKQLRKSRGLAHVPSISSRGPELRLSQSICTLK